jgi:hypothetical protein
MSSSDNAAMLPTVSSSAEGARAAVTTTDSMGAAVAAAATPASRSVIAAGWSPGSVRPVAGSLLTTAESGFGGTAYGFEDQSGFVAASGIFVLTLHVFYRAIAFRLGFKPVSIAPVLANEVGKGVASRRTNADAVELGGFVCWTHACQSLQIFGRPFLHDLVLSRDIVSLRLAFFP